MQHLSAKRFLLSAAACAAASLPGAASAQQPTFAADDQQFSGDHLYLKTNVHGFAPQSAADKGEKCALVGSKLSVHHEATDGKLVVRFYELAAEKGLDSRAIVDCPPDRRVNTFTSYIIQKGELQKYDFRRTGVAFGGLVIPFKFRLGGDRGITASSTIAPYVGFRTHFFQGYGLSFTPIVSAGLGLVPVTDPAAGKTDTKNALSTAVGLVMTSSKNDKFISGLVIGKDFLSNADRALDPNVDKAWLSFYLGVGF